MCKKNRPTAITVDHVSVPAKGFSRRYYSTVRRGVAMFFAGLLVLALMGAASQSDYESAVKYENSKAEFYQPHRIAVEVGK